MPDFYRAVEIIHARRGYIQHLFDSLNHCRAWIKVNRKANLAPAHQARGRLLGTEDHRNQIDIDVLVAIWDTPTSSAKQKENQPWQ